MRAYVKKQSKLAKLRLQDVEVVPFHDVRYLKRDLVVDVELRLDTTRGDDLNDLEERRSRAVAARTKHRWDWAQRPSVSRGN